MELMYSEKGDTWPKVLKYNCEKYGDTRRALRQKHQAYAGISTTGTANSSHNALSLPRFMSLRQLLSC